MPAPGTQPVGAGTGATFSALAYGPDGDLWAMHSVTGPCRIWLGATGRTDHRAPREVSTAGMVWKQICTSRQSDQESM